MSDVVGLTCIASGLLILIMIALTYKDLTMTHAQNHPMFAAQDFDGPTLTDRYDNPPGPSAQHAAPCEYTRAVAEDLARKSYLRDEAHSLRTAIVESADGSVWADPTFRFAALKYLGIAADQKR